MPPAPPHHHAAAALPEDHRPDVELDRVTVDPFCLTSSLENQHRELATWLRDRNPASPSHALLRRSLPPNTLLGEFSVSHRPLRARPHSILSLVVRTSRSFSELNGFTAVSSYAPLAAIGEAP
jgi:hypothetical protein